MARRKKPFIPVPERTAQHRLCSCVAPDLNQCLAQRYAISVALATCLNGCNCRCHVTTSGAVMPLVSWYALRSARTRQQKARTQ